MSSKKSIVIIGITVLLVAIISIVYIFVLRKPKTDNEEPKKTVISTTGVVHSEMGVLQTLDDEVDYQYGNFKLVFKADKDEDKIYIYYNEKVIFDTDYNHAANVRVNIYNDIYLVEIHYPMAQCDTMKLLTVNSDGKVIEEVGTDTEGTISRVEYYSDVNKIIIYKEQCVMYCDDDCKFKYTYEVLNNKFKLLSTETDYDEYLTKVETNGDYTYYSFNFDRALSEEDDSYEFEIDDYKLKYVLTKADNDIKNYEFYVNDKKIYSDQLNGSNIVLKVLGKYIIFTNTFTTDIRSTKLYIYDGIVLKEIYELEGVKGMVANSKTDIVVNKNGILVKGSRVNNGPVIMYNDNSYDTYSKDTCNTTLKELKEDFIVKQDYTFKYTNSILNTTPEKSNKYTLKEYVKNEEFCNSATK